ncbi:APG6-domain-containing protein [Aureobasidium sp. EXF-12298]|nr:APG6-domain-containing protein [Aureobasidium sp. EXF-12298]KAI4766081.1 APG6-domain-containing protein [Aureobasidium sp. EXF-12344]KAI4783580.1 APG6-domain-containing protein [Aureobasidium sp. EXF-3400]
MSYVMLSESQLGPLSPEDPSPSKKVLEKDAKSSEQHDSSSLSADMEKSLRLWEILSSRSDIDHPICSECTDLLLAGLQQRQTTANRERQAYAEFLKKAKADVPSEEEQRQAREALAAAKQQEQKALEELEALEAEKAAMEEEIAALNREEAELEEEEAAFWRERNEFDDTVTKFREQNDSLLNQLQFDTKLLETLQRTNVYNDSFCIDHDGPFGTINGLRLGKLADHSVEWTEINAAWGLCVLLLTVVAEKLGYTFHGYRPLPIGSTSKIEKLEYPANDQSRTGKPKITALDLFCNSDLPLGLGFLHRGFDNAMVAFLECLRQLGEHVEQSPSYVGASALSRKLPYKINKDKIGDNSIKLGTFNQEEAWTRACLAHVPHDCGELNSRSKGSEVPLGQKFLRCTFATSACLFTHHIPLHNAWTIDRETFIQEWMENQIGNSPNRSAIALLCRRPDIKWRPDVVLDLDDANGGVGNVRGNIFDFLSLAILTGSSIMLPSFQSRSAADLSALWNGKIPFDTFFDTDHFVATFAAACPKMDIYMPSKDHSLVPPLQNRYGMPSMRLDIHPETLDTPTPNTPKGAVDNFNHWLSVQPDYDPQKTTLVSVGRSLWEGLDTRALPAAVRRDFGGSLRLIPEVRRLAAIVTYNLALKYHLHSIDPRLPYYKSAFLGAHLRTESDAKAAGWLNDEGAAAHANYTGQTDAYLSQAVEHDLSVIYVASGNATEISRFTEKAWHLHSFNVTSKSALLSGSDLEALENLTWDQQGLVDYEVLRRSSSLAGFARSSFAFNIAITRNEFVDVNQEALWLRPEHLKKEDVAFEDGLSKIWGRFPWQEKRMLRGAWP